MLTDALQLGEGCTSADKASLYFLGEMPRETPKANKDIALQWRWLLNATPSFHHGEKWAT